jgi:hypothetical protein
LSGAGVSYTVDIGYFLPGIKMAELEALQVGSCSAEVKKNILSSISLHLTFVYIANYFKHRHNPI